MPPVLAPVCGQKNEKAMPMLAKQQVLLVDDEPQILVALEDLLRDQFVVFTAQSGRAALELMDKKDDIAVVVTDQRMPQMQGDELVSRLQDQHLAQRILVTGYADLGAVVRAVNEGQIFAYVTKPWNEDDLRLKVSKAAEQFRLSRQLASEKRLLDDLMNNSPDGIYFKDGDLRFIRVNKTIADWFETDVNDLVGKKLTDVMSSASEAKSIEEEEQASLRDNRPLLDLVRQTTIAHSVRWFSETKAPVHGLDDTAPGLIGISRDITRQRDLEQQLLQSQKMEAMGKLAGGVAHDFNNLLVVIQGYGELLHDELSPEDELRDHVVQQLKAVDRAASLTKQLLTFSRNGPSRTTILDVNAALTDLVQMLRRLIPDNVDLVLDLSPDRKTVQVDATRFEQVLINLVINARDAMPQGGQIAIKTELVQPTKKSAVELPPWVRISVKDTGSGISPEILDRIFEPFFSTKEIGKGTGLGLSTVYGIVRQLGGDIFVESELGKGTCFSVEIPSSNGARSSAPKNRAKQRTIQGSETVLIVEDDDDVREITQRILEDNGYTVLLASSPSQAQAVSVAFEGQIDLILTDVSMPEMDGLSLVESLAQKRPEMQVLYMSGYVEIEATEARLIQDNCNYLEKPFGPERLLNTVRDVLELA